jgi:hypothetical protein
VRRNYFGLPIRVFIRQPKQKPDGDNSKTLDTIVKVVGLIISVATVFIGIWEFNRQERTTNTIEFKRKIWEKKLDAYMQLDSLTSLIANETVDTLLNREIRQLDLLYWGKLPLFDDPTVEEAVKDFRNKAKDKQEHIEDIFNPNILKISAYTVVKSCQKSINNSYEELAK